MAAQSSFEFSSVVGGGGGGGDVIFNITEGGLELIFFVLEGGYNYNSSFSAPLLIIIAQSLISNSVFHLVFSQLRYLIECRGYTPEKAIKG